MLYSYDDTFKIILRIYEYLQLRARIQPRMIKLYSQTHRNSVVSFMEKLPPSAGADFIWEFLLFQFYVYSTQDQELRPLPVWFMGKEAWRRWREYDDGARWHTHQWAAEKHLENPVKSKNYRNVEEDVLRNERLRMSRISGANFCVAKYGETPYNSADEICNTCPFEKGCITLFGDTDQKGKNLFQTLQDIPITPEEQQHMLGKRIKTRSIKPVERYGTTDNEV